LPPNSTHLQQPLDVAFFAPLKRIWRNILSEFKATVRNKGSIFKADFPRLLGRLINELMEAGKGSTNIKAGFEATGICPIDPNRVLRKLPGGVAQSSSDNIVVEAIEKMIAPQRYHDHDAGTSSRRRPPAKRIKVAPGKSVGNLRPNDEESEASEEPDGIDQNFPQDQAVAAPHHETVVTVESILDLAKNDFVAAVWEKSWWIGRIEDLSVISHEAKINFLHAVGNSRLQYRWPNDPDHLSVKIADVLRKLKFPLVPVQKRNQIRHYELEEKCLDEIETVFLNRICGQELPMSAY
jgi:hypothetical protein